MSQSMIWVVFRPAVDAQKNTVGEAWIGRHCGYDVDETIYPNGGIILKTIERSSPNIEEAWTSLEGYSPDGRPIVRHGIRVHKRRVIETRLGDDREWNPTPSTIYVCEPVEYDAKYICSTREGWRYQGFKTEADIPRITDVEESGQVVSRQEDLPLGPPPPELSPSAEAVMEREALKADAKKLMDAGAPMIKLSSSPDKLAEYVQLHSNKAETVAASGGS